MQKDTKSRQSDRPKHPDSFGALIWLGRFLLAMSAISLVTAPLTQHLWTWDHFLHGGQDFELAALALFIALGLVLVLSRQCRLRVGSLFASWRLLPNDSGARALTQNPAYCRLSIDPTGPSFDRASTFYSLPLQI